jgi:NAD(P)-dependent dehydrogenase (short-subunit alcohol dehydrogenase family)
MSAIDAFKYDGKRVLVVGGATGMGAAAARTAGSLGAEVIVMDHAPVEFDVDQAIKVDLRDRGSIDAALSEVDGY